MTRNGDPWVTGWAAAAGLVLVCLGLFLQPHIKNTQPHNRTQQELAQAALEHAFDSVVIELDSIRAMCPEQEGDR